MTGSWPHAGDLPVDRARQVCLTYREALRKVDPAAAEAIDAAAASVGEGWVAGDVAVELSEDWVTAARGAELVGRSRRWVYQFAAEHPESVCRDPGQIRVRLADLRSAVAHERGRRARRAPNSEIDSVEI